MKNEITLFIAVSMTLSIFGGNSAAAEWHNYEMLQAFGKPGDTVVTQEWTTPEALLAFGKPGDTVHAPEIQKPHKHKEPRNQKHQRHQKNCMNLTSTDAAKR